MVRVLFVCLGNICRSPLAEAIFNHQIRQSGLQGEFLADSCGTADYHVGDSPDSRTIRNASKNGITIRHLGRQFGASDFDQFDLILPMDASNYSHLIAMQDAVKSKIRMMRSFDSVDTGGDVPDPYSRDEKAFQEVFEILDRSVAGLIKSLVAGQRKS